MPWNAKVMDNLEQVYWSPDKIGLQSLPLSLDREAGGYVVPEVELAGGKSLYRRTGTFRGWRATIRKKEEILNHVIEIALAIAPSSLLSRALFAPLGIDPGGRIATIGREILLRHASLAPQQFTQHDGFYVAPSAIVMMEMKLKARTSVEQYLKYCTLAALEESLHGRKDRLGLVYLVPGYAQDRTRRDLQIGPEGRPEHVWDNPSSFTSKSVLLRLLSEHEPAIRDVGQRLQLTFITWDDFLADLRACREEAIAAGNETLENLMQGLIDQILATPDCGLREAG